MLEIKVGDAIELRTLQEKDAEALFALMDTDRPRLREWLPWVDKTQSSADTLKFIQASAQEPSEEKECSLGIWFEGALAGALGIHDVSLQNRKSTLGYWLGSQFEGQGIMTESVKAVITKLFKDYNLHRIEISCGVENEKSAAIPKRLGFTLVGKKRDAEWLYDHFIDLHTYEMVEQDWSY